MFPIAITYAIWIPLEIIFYFIVAYFSKKNNDFGGKKFMAIVVILNFIPLWAFIAPDSKNLAFDMLLYDTIMTFILTLTLIALGSGSKFKFHNWLGVGIVIIGFVLMKL